MQIPPIPASEPRRLENLYSYEVLDTLPERAFDDLAWLASSLCRTPVALINFVGSQRVQAKAKVGWDRDVMSRDEAPCSYVVAHERALVVGDTREDDRFAGNPLVQGDSPVLSYVGAPLRTPQGEVVGTICVMDFEPRTLTEEQVSALGRLADQVVGLLETRRAMKQLRGGVAERDDALKRLRINEEASRTAFEAAPDGIVKVNESGQILYVNRAFREIFGYEADELVGRSVDMLIPRRLRGAHRSGFSRYLRTGRARMKRKSVPLPGLRKDGSEVPMEVSLSELASVSGRIFMAFMRDVSERQRMEEALRVREERYCLATRGSHNAMWDWDVSRGVVFFAARWWEMLGGLSIDREEKVEGWYARVHPDDLDELQADLVTHMEGLSETFENCHRVQHAEGHYIWVEVRGNAVRSNGKTTRVVGLVTDVTEKIMQDASTGLPNLKALEEELEGGQDVERLLMLFSVDRYNAIRQLLGDTHPDQFLAAVARRVGECLSPEQRLYRVSGSKLAVLERLEAGECAGVAERRFEKISERLDAPFIMNGREIFVGLSAGACLVGRESTFHGIVRDARAALDVSRRGGFGQLQVFNDDLRSKLDRRLCVESELRVAISDKELQLYFQPIVSMLTGELEGFEALSRWTSSTLGPVGPGEFIPIAEDSDLIIPLGWHALRSACEQCVAWQRFRRNDRPMMVSVNVSGRQLLQPDVVDLVRAILQESGLDPRLLKLEVTESILLSDAQWAINTLEALSRLNVQISMDDFGTGYSSLSYMRTLPLDVLKIDQSFVRNIKTTHSDASLCRTIVQIARDLDLQVIAEGVETESQARMLCDFGCDLGQGYLFSKPLPPEHVERIILAEAGWWRDNSSLLSPRPVGGVMQSVSSWRGRK